MLHFPRWKIALILIVVLAGLVTTFPNFFSESTVKSWPDWLPKRQVVLGLDLQGGAYLLYEVDRTDYIKTRLQSLRGEVRKAMRPEGGENIGYTGLAVQGDSVQFRIRDIAKLEEARTRLQPLENPLASSILGGTPVNEFALTSTDDGLFRFEFTEEGLAQRIRSVVDQSIEVVRLRVDEFGVTEPSIQREGDDRILVEAPGVRDPARLKDLIGQTAKMTFHEVCRGMTPEQALQTRPPSGCIVVEGLEDPPQLHLLKEDPVLSGEDLVDAQPAFDQQTNEPIVTFRFNTSGGATFGNFTQQHVGEPFAIVLDNEVITAPVIREPILSGSGQISGQFTVETSNDLAILLRAGALPAELTINHESTVGPGLGADSVAAGRIASIVALVAVIVFMVLAYGLFGVIADLALMANIFLVFGALSALQATLTLPGIAGIVLTVGMAVDANVLIFERIREEVRQGRTPINAIDAGYSRALTTILDANITTFLAAVILFQLGSGPIRGFAVTLMIGIVTTVFTAFTFSRLMIALWVRMRRPTAIPI